MDGMINTAQGRQVAYRQQPGHGPQVVFLHGYRSDMTGTKAEMLAEWAGAHGHGFLRFDLSGHGDSGGKLVDFGIADWLEDVTAVITQLAQGPVVLVGSSLGGWLSLLVARAQPERIAGLVTVAAAPDFTTRIEREMTEGERQRLTLDGQILRPSAYGGMPDVFSRRLLDQGRRNLVLTRELPLPMPVRLLQGTADRDVPMEDALQLLSHAEGENIRLTLVKGADHRFSTPECLSLLAATVAEVAAG